MSVIWSGVTEEGAVVPVQVTAEGKVVAVGDGPEGEYLKLTGGNLTGDLTIDTDKIALNANGSATFAGDVKIGGTLPAAPNIYLYELGLAEFVRPDKETYTQLNGSIGADRFVTGGAYIGGVKDAKWSLSNLSGSATFAGETRATDGSSYSFLAASGWVSTYRDKPAGNSGADLLFAGANETEGVFRVYTDGSAEFVGAKCGFTSAGELFFTSRNERYKLIVSNGICQAEPYTRQMELKEKAEQFIADKRETKPSEPQVEVTPDNDNA